MDDVDGVGSDRNATRCSQFARQVPTWSRCRPHGWLTSTVDREQRGHDWGVESIAMTVPHRSSYRLKTPIVRRGGVQNIQGTT